MFVIFYLIKNEDPFVIFKNFAIKDGEHEDIRVSRAEPHKKYNKIFHLNDIGLVYLERDVTFTGMK